MATRCRSAPGPPAGQPDLVFERYLLEDVAPLVEAQYRIAPGRRNRAIVGLSMGGGHATQIALGHRDRFAWVGVFGAGYTRADFEARYRAKLPPAPARARPRARPFELFFIGVGKQDGVLGRAQELSEALTANGVPTTYFETDGGHTYPTWRKLLVADGAAAVPSAARGKQVRSRPRGRSRFAGGGERGENPRTAVGSPSQRGGAVAIVSRRAGADRRSTSGYVACFSGERCSSVISPALARSFVGGSSWQLRPRSGSCR